MTRQQALLGALLVALVLVAWWLLLLKPRSAEMADLREEVETTRVQQNTVRTRVRALEAIRSAAPDIEADLARARTLVPASTNLPATLRQLQDAADQSGIQLDSISPTRPSDVADVPGLQTFDVGLTLAGGYYQWVDFVRRVEDPQLIGRGVLVQAIDVTPSDYPELTGNVQLRMFSTTNVSPAADETATDTTAQAAAGTEESS